jgi:protein CpxP
MKSKKMLGLIIAGTVVIVGTLIFTGTLLAGGDFSKCVSRCCMHQGMHRGMMGMNMFMNLNLSDTQKDQMQAIITNHQDQMENTVAELRQTMRETMFNAIFAEEFNEEKIRAAFRETSPAREEMVVQKAKMIAEIKTILDPEQLELLKERKTQMMENRRSGFRRMMFKSCFQNSHG